MLLFEKKRLSLINKKYMNLDTNGYMYFGYTCLSIEQVNNNNGNTVSNNKIIYIKFQ